MEKMTPIYIETYDYALPDEKIAKYPLEQRDNSKLLVYKNGTIQESIFRHIGDFLPSDSLLVYNNTKVIQARLQFQKATGAKIEIFCLEPLSPRQYELALGSKRQCTWLCMVGNAKKWKEGDLTHVLADKTVLRATKQATIGNSYQIEFTWENETLSFAEILDQIGVIPIPPYLNRESEERDKTTYQTIYSLIKGSVAAPTAGLHFTHELLRDLQAQGIQTAEVTLHVGAGTFQPIKVADANDHVMHTEIISVCKPTLQSLLRSLGHVVAVGTTSMRTLESLYYIGEALHNGVEPDRALCVSQFVPYEAEHTLPTQEALQAIVAYLESHQLDTLHAQTQIMIKPDFRFRLVDALITNFHQPKSTLLLLVDAFLGGKWRTIYDYALHHNFRFLSYGDSNLYFRE
ncbi:MAG: S-adenosylmethionine:tRNA ribosyltransferase-isomerase [Paludibacteraceae bacterium]|nr:S-adenosylmethionine:tRNA ribosyltransferase-isomerase [Paludibacteraceae bacterium]